MTFKLNRFEKMIAKARKNLGQSAGATLTLIIIMVAQVTHAGILDGDDKLLASIVRCQVSYKVNDASVAQSIPLTIKEKRSSSGGQGLTAVGAIDGKGYSFELGQQASRFGSTIRTESRVFLFNSIEAANSLDYTQAQFAGGENLSQGSPTGTILIDAGIGCHAGACWRYTVSFQLTCE